MLYNIANKVSKKRPSLLTVGIQVCGVSQNKYKQKANLILHLIVVEQMAMQNVLVLVNL